MKKTVCFGLLVILLVFGFIGCDDDDENPIKGTWVGTDGGGNAFTATFGDSTYEAEGDGYKAKGTYTYSGNTAQITQTHMDFGSGWTTDGGLPYYMTANINGNVMTIEFQGTITTLTKQN